MNDGCDAYNDTLSVAQVEILANKHGYQKRERMLRTA
jgi:hypothetical protein